MLHPVRRFKSRLRAWENTERGWFIRLYPNPGFTLFGVHFCFKHGFCSAEDY